MADGHPESRIGGSLKDEIDHQLALLSTMLASICGPNFDFDLLSTDEKLLYLEHCWALANRARTLLKDIDPVTAQDAVLGGEEREELGRANTGRFFRARRVDAA